VPEPRKKKAGGVLNDRGILRCPRGSGGSSETRSRRGVVAFGVPSPHQAEVVGHEKGSEPGVCVAGEVVAGEDPRRGVRDRPRRQAAGAEECLTVAGREGHRVGQVDGSVGIPGRNPHIGGNLDVLASIDVPERPPADVELEVPVGWSFFGGRASGERRTGLW